MTTDLKGKTAVVTGGSRGIGAAITRQFAAMGADVAILYAGNQQAAEAICEACQTEYGVRAKAYRCDVSNFEDTKKTMTEIKKDTGKQRGYHQRRADADDERRRL